MNNQSIILCGMDMESMEFIILLGSRKRPKNKVYPTGCKFYLQKSLIVESGTSWGWQVG